VKAGAVDTCVDRAVASNALPLFIAKKVLIAKAARNMAAFDGFQ